MWEVYEHRRLARRLSRLPIETLKRCEIWKDVVRVSGPAGLRLIKGFHDVTLRGERKGHRSSRLGGQYRITYDIAAQAVRVYVNGVTAHDYRKKWADGTE